MKRQGNGCKISVFKEQRDSKEGQLKLQIFIKTWATTIFLTSVSFKNKFGKSPKEIH
jgi:hypothetical protein